MFSNEPGILFAEQTFVGMWCANRAAWSVESKLQDLFSEENRQDGKQTSAHRHWCTDTSGCHVVKIVCIRPATC